MTWLPRHWTKFTIFERNYQDFYLNKITNCLYIRKNVLWKVKNNYLIQSNFLMIFYFDGRMSLKSKSDQPYILASPASVMSQLNLLDKNRLTAVTKKKQ